MPKTPSNLSLTFFALLLWATVGNVARCEIDRVGAVDLAAGFPQLLSVEAQLLALPRWQVGAGYGILPGSLSFTPHVKGVESFTTNIKGVDFKLDPNVKTNLTAISPFVRFFPTENNFYLQFTYAMLVTKSDVTTGLKDIDDNPVAGALIKAHVDLTQIAPTISIGHMFTSHAFFLNFALGATIFTTVSSNKISIDGALPDRLGDSAAKQEALEKIKNDLNNSLQASVDKAKKEILFIPSILLSFGFLI